MKTHNHHLECDAPICVGDPNENYKSEVLWYAGESVCQKTPYQKFQIKQNAVNKEVAKGRFKNMDIAYTANDLETKSI